MSSRRIGLLGLVGLYSLALPGLALASGQDSVASDAHEVAYRRFADNDDAVVLDDIDDEDETLDLSDDVTDSNETKFAATATSNADGDATRGDDGTNGARTVTFNGDGDATRGDDGTAGGDGGTRTVNADGDGTKGDDGTNGAATVTENLDGDATRGNDGTDDGDNTFGEDGTSGGDDTATTTVGD